MNDAVPPARRLAGFTGAGYDKGRNLAWQAAWVVVLNVVFMAWWCPLRLRPAILRLFGADIGTGVRIRHRVRVLWPWKLRVGDHSWIGEGVWILNLEEVSIGRDVCLSQESFLCAGSHDAASPTFEFDNGPIEIGDGAWICARATVLRGSVVPADAVVAAGTVHRPAGRRG